MSRGSDPISLDLPLFQPSLDGFPRMVAHSGDIRGSECFFLHKQLFCFFYFLYIDYHSVTHVSSFFSHSRNAQGVGIQHFLSMIAPQKFRPIKNPFRHFVTFYSIVLFPKTCFILFFRYLIASPSLPLQPRFFRPCHNR